MKFLTITLTLLLFHPILYSQEDALLDIQKDYESFGKNNDKTNVSPWKILTETEVAEDLSFFNDLNERLTKLSKDNFSTSSRINYDLLTLLINDRIFHLEFGTHLMPLNAEGGFLADIVYGIQGSDVNNDDAFEQYTEKLAALPEYLLKRTHQMTAGQAAGVSSPKLVVQSCIKLLDLLLSKPAEETYFVDPVRNDESRTTQVVGLLDRRVIPAFKEFRDYLEIKYLVNAPEQVGISAIKDGKKFYEQRVRFFTTLDIKPEEVFEIGQKEVKRIRKEMEAIIDDLAFQGSYADFLEFLRTDEQFYCKTGEDLLEKAAWITKRMEGQLPKYFGKLPRMPLTVTPVPEALAPNYTGGRYSPGSYKNNKAGEYWVNTYNLPSRPLYVLPALSLHEGVPGHHLQIMLAAELEDVANFRRSTYLSAYGEGWALYTEYLGKEAGIYRTAYEDFGRLTYEMWRACRLVVDPGMHYMGWTREEAVEFMASNTALSLHEVNTEIDRYIGWPGQAVSYKMGELKIRELRKFAEDQLGDDFSIRDFHDLVLSQGAVPLETLQWMVESWIAGK